MADFTTLYDESTRPANRHFHAPGFELRIDGVGLPQGVLRDVIQLVYHDDTKEIDGFEIVVNNWDDAARRCKYIGSETAAQLDGNASTNFFKLFEPCNKTVQVTLGYVGDLQAMMRGNFTTMEPNFPEQGAPVLSVRGLNVLHRLRKKKFSYAWTSKKPSEIALNFNTLRDGSQPRLQTPWKVTIDDQAKQAEDPIDYIAQADQYDVDFLLRLAHSQGYEIEAREDTHEIFFGPSQRAVVNYELEWGKGLVSFKPTLSTANQWKSVTVRGWDRQTQKPISETVDLNDPALKKLNANLHEMVQDCDPREQQTVDLPVFTRAEAKRKAQALLRDRHAQIITARGKTVGLPRLRAGTNVAIKGLGARLSGTYFVTKTTHTLGEAGYVTEFDCRREDLDSKPRSDGGTAA